VTDCRYGNECGEWLCSSGTNWSFRTPSTFRIGGGAVGCDTLAGNREQHCHYNVTRPLPRAAHHVKAPDGTGNAHAPPYASIPMVGGIAPLHVPLCAETRIAASEQLS